MAHDRIVLTAPINPSAVELLAEVAPVEVAAAPDEATMMTLLAGTIGLVARGEGVVTGRMIAACPTLRVIGRPGAGYDTVDVAAATERGIPVVRAPVGGFAVAEGAMALLLALVKKLPLSDQLVKTGQWHKRYEFASGDMAERTLGIIGLGDIGAYLAKLAGAFNMHLLGCDPFVAAQRGADMGVELVALDELLRRSDYVSLHVPLNEHTRGLINRERIGQMKPGAILINTARGGVVDSLDVLAEALHSGQLSAVGLDVFPAEPPDVSHRIFSDPRCLCAPHLVGVSELAMERICLTMARGMIAVLRGRQPEYCVNPEVLA